MKRDVKLIALVFLIVISASFALYYTFRPESCEQYSCFQDNMITCSRATFLNEEPEASWQYTIKRQVKDNCEIDVVLLQAKEGDLKLRNFEKHEMTCIYPVGVAAYPDKDLSVCHGRLKEDLQGIIIEKLHAYIIGNLDDIKSGFNLEVITNTTNTTITG